MTTHRINQYTCDLCDGHIITVERDEGTTPLFIRCRATPNCPGKMLSAMYRISPLLAPNHEWYKPTHPLKDQATRDYVKNGGLLLREIKSPKTQ